MAPVAGNADVDAPPSVPLSFSNNFWGRDDAGVDPLLSRMNIAKTTCDELRAFYKARLELEEEYARKLLALARKPLGSIESGTLRTSLDVTRGETEQMGKQHALIAQQMKAELEEPLTAFAGGMKERRKIVQGGIERLLKTKQAQTIHVNKARDKYEQDCLRVKGYLAQGHMVMGQEERKNKAKLEKTQINMASNSQEYEAAVKVLEETTGRWNKEWKAACDKFQDLEEERLDFTKSSLWAFANIASTVCVTDDASCEKVRLALEQCEVEKDITSFIKTYGTGQEIPDPPRYINFCRGDLDAASEVSEDDNYSVAQFPRTTNPAFRTSSPSHVAPDDEFDGQRMSEEPVEEIDVSTPTGPNSGRPKPLNYRQPGPQVPPNYSPNQHGEVLQIAHNEYPTDGMTMFCRAGPSSATSSALSANTRPVSRDDQSDYSNPSSFTSAEPPSGKSSPTKAPPVNGVELPGMTSSSPDKAVQKKRSGFFSNSPFNSPFRRKSKKDLNRGADAASNNHHSNNRASWNVSSKSVNLTASQVSTSSAQSSPTKSPTRQLPFNHNASRMAPEGEEPADPRASFQLNIGQNVLDVSNPDSEQHTPRANNTVGRRGGQLAALTMNEHDPVAQALANLKQSSNGSNLGMNKQASVRQPVDNYHRVKTPAPDSAPTIRPGVSQDVLAAQRGTPPPAYDGRLVHRRAESALGVPQPAFTSKEMRSRTETWGNGSSVSAPVSSNRPSSSMGRPASRDGRRSPGPPGNAPRAVSPQPQFNRNNGARSPGPQYDHSNRSRSPAPQFNRSNGARSPGPPPNAYQRSASPNPHAGNGGQRSRGQSRPPPANAGMEMQLARYADDQSYSRSQDHSNYASSNAGSNRSRHSMMNGGGGGGSAVPSSSARPQSAYGGDPYQSRRGPSGPGAGAGGHDSGSARGRPTGMDVELRRERSKSVANIGYSGGGGHMVPAGRSAPLHYARAMYTYNAAIPEELSFNKGDILAVLRMQDDGWWEAEVSRSVKGGAVGVGGVGLVPSNYLQRC